MVSSKEVKTMEKATAQKIGDIMAKAVGMARQDEFLDFSVCVGMSFWRSFGRYEQSHLMQEVYCILCDMGYTPLESHQNY